MFTRIDTIHERDGHQTDRRTDTARQHRPRLCRHRTTTKLNIVGGHVMCFDQSYKSDVSSSHKTKWQITMTDDDNLSPNVRRSCCPFSPSFHLCIEKPWCHSLNPEWEWLGTWCGRKQPVQQGGGLWKRKPFYRAIHCKAWFQQPSSKCLSIRRLSATVW